MADVGPTAAFECIDDGRKHSSYRIWCDTNADGIVDALEQSAEGRVKCRNGKVRRTKGDLKNFACAAESGKKKKNKHFFG